MIQSTKIYIFLPLIILFLSCRNDNSVATTTNQGSIPPPLPKRNGFICGPLEETIWYEVGTWILDRNKDTLAISDLFSNNNLSDMSKLKDENGERIQLHTNGNFEAELDDGMGLYHVEGRYHKIQDSLQIIYNDYDNEEINYKVVLLCKDDFFITITSDLQTVKMFTINSKLKKYASILEEDNEFLCKTYSHYIESKGLQRFIYAKKIYKREGIFLQQVNLL